jgi:hypothetical protein
LEVSGQIHAPVALPPGERAPSDYWIGGWVDPRSAKYREKMMEPQDDEDKIEVPQWPISFSEHAVFSLKVLSNMADITSKKMFFINCD